jgi:hypothetical protein
MNVYIKLSMNLYYRFMLTHSVFWDGAQVSGPVGFGV